MKTFLLICFGACVIISLAYVYGENYALAAYWIVLAIINLINHHHLDHLDS